MAFLRPPIQQNGMFEALPIQKKCTFESPLYNKMAFWIPPIQRIFRPPPKPKMAEIRPPIQKMTKLGSNWPIFDPLIKMVKI